MHRQVHDDRRVREPSPARGEPDPGPDSTQAGISPEPQLLTGLLTTAAPVAGLTLPGCDWPSWQATLIPGPKKYKASRPGKFIFTFW